MAFEAVLLPMVWAGNRCGEKIDPGINEGPMNAAVPI